jgi:glutamate dehydrogenase (NAD(P)+)
MGPVRIHKVAGTDAFVVFDLDEAPRSVGPVRLAPKILRDGAELLARSVTYLAASFEQRVGGASGGVNTRQEGRAEAVAAFVADLRPLIEKGELSVEAGKGLSAADLAPLAEADAAALPTGPRRDALLAAGVAAAAERALGGLDGRTVAIEGWGQAPVALVPALAARGARVVAVGTATATVTAEAGLDAAALADGTTDPAGLGEAGPAGAILAAPADVLLAGSKAGVLDHTAVEAVTARAVVPWGPVPVTAKALAALGRQGAVVVPDFLATAGPALQALGLVEAGDPPDAAGERAAALIIAALDEVLGHERGPVLGACLRAEAFLGTWQQTLPFGRPIA